MSEDRDDIDAQECLNLVNELIEGVRPLIETVVLKKTEDGRLQNMAISAFGITMAAATLRSVTDKDAAATVAGGLLRHFIAECKDVLDEQWGDRENPQ